jgi:hypothetical protein
MANLNLIDMGRRPTPQIRYHPSDVENLIIERKKRRNYNLKRVGEQLLGANEIDSKDYPWSF